MKNTIIAGKRSMGVVVLAGLLAWHSAASADTVRLMNGRQLTGIVTEEDDFFVTLDLGPGTTTLNKSGVLEVVRSEASETSELQDALNRKRLQDDLFQPSYARSRSGWGRKSL